MDGAPVVPVPRDAGVGGYQDRGGLAVDSVPGFRTIGDLPATVVFPPKEGPAPRTMLGVMADARRAQRAVLSTRGGPCDDELGRELLRVTLKEHREGWLSAPRSQAELVALLGTRWLPVRRFGTVSYTHLTLPTILRV